MEASIYEETNLDEIVAKESIEQPYLQALLDTPEIFSQEWKQTSVVDAPQIENVELLRTRWGKILIVHHRRIRLDPYNPKVWIDRGRHFIRLGYGELAVSDAYKARVLLDSFLSVFKTNRLYLDADELPVKVHAALAGVGGERDTGAARAVKASNVPIAKLLEEQAILVMALALISVRAYYDAIQVLDEAIVLYDPCEQLQVLHSQVQEKSRLMEQSLQAEHRSPEYIQKSMKQGGVERVAYPWINPEELRRGNKAMKKVKNKFEIASTNATLCPTSVGGIVSDNHGIFARQDISKDDLIVIDKSAFTVLNFQSKKNCWACSEPLDDEAVSTNCCKATFCNYSCKTEAMNSYHRVLCKQDFKWLYEASKGANQQSNDMIPLVLMKVLATAVQQNARPLKVACVGSLKVDYQKKLWSIFKFHENVVAPIKILQTLGVNVFTDLRFDAWAIQTLILRIDNNMNDDKEGEVMYSAICPLFSMFNHDCDPSATWPYYHLGGPVSVVANRDIKRGEEISVSYIGTLDDIDLERDRRMRLMAQIGTLCSCTRCYKERKVAFEEDAPPNVELLQLLNEVGREESDTTNNTLRPLRDELFSI